MSRPYVIQNLYKNTSEPGNRLIGYDELQDAIVILRLHSN